MLTFTEACFELYNDCIRLSTYIIHFLFVVTTTSAKFIVNCTNAAMPTIVIYYSSFVYNLKLTASRLNEYDNVRKFVYYLRTAHAFIHEYRIEPLDPSWICASYIGEKALRNPYVNNGSYQEKYDILSDITNDDEQISAEPIIVDRLRDWCICMENDPIADSYLLTCKYNNLYTHILKKVDNTVRSSHDTMKLNTRFSKIKFLSIEYVNEADDTNIVITLPKEHHMVGNHILSAEFVNRYLEYNGEGHRFVMDYKLKIMDSNITTFELKNNEYIILQENGYLISK